MLKYGLLAVVVVLIATYTVVLFTDLWKNRETLTREPGNPALLCVTGPLILFLATLGISDFIINTLLFKKLRLVDDKRLPGTLVTCVGVPLGVVAIAHLMTTAVDLKLIATYMICQAAGSFIGVRAVSQLDGSRIKKVVGAAMLISAGFLVLRLFGVGGDGGTLTSLSVPKMIVCGVCAFFLGIGNMIGIGSKAPSLSLLLLMGLPASGALSVILSSCTAGGSLGSIQYVRKGLYQRKIALIYSTVGFIGIAAGFLLVMNLPQNVLQIVMIGISVYTGISMLRK